VLVRYLKPRANINGAVRAEAEECIGIVSARIDEVVDVVRPGTMILVVTARIFLVTRPIEVTPREGEMRKVPLPLTTEVLDVVAKCVE